MNTNRNLLDFLFETKQIDLRRGSIFDSPPQHAPVEPDFDRVKGMMLGLEVGDALGNTTEGWLPEHRAARFGEIRDYLQDPHGDKPAGVPSDDTQLAFWTLEQIKKNRGFQPDHVAARFCSGMIFGIGSAVKQFTVNYRSGKLWYQSGARSAGNGALMRIAPILIPHLRTGTTDLLVDAALLALITHNDPASIASCVAFVSMYWEHLLKLSKRLDGTPPGRQPSSPRPGEFSS